jgi:hypothetical protein
MDMAGEAKAGQDDPLQRFMKLSPEERDARNRRFVENMRRAAEAESAEARAAEWRGATAERHARVLADVVDLADALQRSRPTPYIKPPLNYPHLPGRPSSLCQ